MNNAETVQQMYDAFLRGDVQAILDRVSDDVEWEYGAAPSDIPWLQTRRGRAGVGEFFSSLQGVEFHRFEPTTIFEKDKLVVALFNVEFTVLSTGKRIVEEDEVHIWHFDEQGRVVRFRHRLDTMLHKEALEGASVLVS